MALYLSIANASNRRQNIERIIRDRRNPLDYMSDSEIVSNYRLSRPMLLEICSGLETLRRSSNRANALPVSLQVVIALRFFAKGEFQSENGEIHGVCPLSVSRSVHTVAKVIIKNMAPL